MTKFRTGAYLAFISGCFLLSGAAANADSKYYKRSFDVTSTIDSGKNGVMTSRTISDGKGHQRLETKTANGTTVSIIDINNKKLATVMETSKMVIMSPFNEKDPESVKKENLKSLGKQTINGHPCKGESYTVGTSKFEVWTGTDIDYPVQSTVENANGKTMTVLKSYSKNPPATTSYEIPTTGYKIVGNTP